MMPRAVFDDVGLFDETLRADVDGDMWLRVLKTYRARYLPGASLRYRVHGAALSADKPLMRGHRSSRRSVALPSSATARWSTGFARIWPGRRRDDAGADERRLHRGSGCRTSRGRSFARPFRAGLALSGAGPLATRARASSWRRRTGSRPPAARSCAARPGGRPTCSAARPPDRRPALTLSPPGMRSSRPRRHTPEPPRQAA